MKLEGCPENVVKACPIPNAIVHWFERSSRGC